MQGQVQGSWQSNGYAGWTARR